MTSRCRTASTTSRAGMRGKLMDYRDDEPNLEELMQLGIQSARNGNTENARVIF